MMKATVENHREIILEQEGLSWKLDGRLQSLDINELRPGSYHLLAQGKSYRLEVLAADPSSKKYSFRINGKRADVVLRDRFDDLLKEMGMDAAAVPRSGDLKAPMPGLVVEVPVKEGQEVAKGDTLVILEAMKMENALKAPAQGVVRKIAVKKGQAVEKNEILIHIG